jgi:hypothetical protein
MALYDYVTGAGVIVPDTSQILADVEAEFKAALGDDLVTDPETPEGLLIAQEVAARDAVARNNAKVANQINPNEAGGTFLDAIWALSGGERIPTTKSYALCAISGTPGTIIPTSVQFRSQAGDLWQVQAETIIDVDGTGIAEAAAVTPGPISAASNTITNIVIGVLGLETVTNPDAAVLGTLTQSDLSTRRARKLTLGRQGTALPAAIIAELYATPNVRSLRFLENITDAEQTISGILMVPHSIYVCVDGGSDADVAAALLSKKSLGCNWNGSVDVTVIDEASEQPYLVRFDRPTLVPILARVTVQVTNPLINPQTAVRDAILLYADGGLEGEDGLTVGTGASPFEFASAINRLEPGVFVRDLELALQSDGIFDRQTIPIAVNQKATINSAAIQVVINT